MSKHTSTIKMNSKDLIAKVNQFREAASPTGSMNSYSTATNLLQELTWLLEPGERDMLGESWRNGLIDNTTDELNRACDSVIKRIQLKK